MWTGLALPGRLEPAGDLRSFADPQFNDMPVSGPNVSVTQTSSMVTGHLLVLIGVTGGREVSDVSGSLVLRSDGNKRIRGYGSVLTIDGVTVI